MSNTQGKLWAKHAGPYFVAQDILSRRDNSEYEMRAKLRKKGFTTEEITQAVEWLAVKHLLDDRQLAARYIDSTLRVKAVGPRWIKSMLQRRGIAHSIINEALKVAFTADKERALAQQATDVWLRQTRRRRDRHSRSSSSRRRLQRFLLSRGFAFEAINSVT